MTTMYSKVRIAGHPVHPMLVAFPVAFYTATLIAFAGYAASSDVFWWRIGLVLNAAGVLTAVIAAIPGFIDWATGIPRTARRRPPAGRTCCSTSARSRCSPSTCSSSPTSGSTSCATRERPASSRRPTPGSRSSLSALGVLLTGAAGFFGWKLVQTHHVGVDLSEEQRRLEPTLNDPGSAEQRGSRTLA